MNQIRAIQALNKKEIENGVPPEASWHVDYRDTAYVYFGGLPFEMSEGDVITIFSQFGEPVFLKLARDKETGKSRGFGWLKYEDQRSTDLAVDNLGGTEIGGRMIRVDHARYKPRDDDDPNEGNVSWEFLNRKDAGEETEEEEDEEEARPMLQEEKELALLIRDHDDDDPMKAFLIEEKKKEVEEALKEVRRSEKRIKKHKHRHHRSHKSRADEDDDRDLDEERDRERKSKSRRDDSPKGSYHRGRDRESRRDQRPDDYLDGHTKRQHHERMDIDDEDDRERGRARHRERHEREDSEDYGRRRGNMTHRDQRHRHRSRSRSPGPRRHR